MGQFRMKKLSENYDFFWSRPLCFKTRLNNYSFFLLNFSLYKKLIRWLNSHPQRKLNEKKKNERVINNYYYYQFFLIQLWNLKERKLLSKSGLKYSKLREIRLILIITIALKIIKHLWWRNLESELGCKLSRA